MTNSTDENLEIFSNEPFKVIDKLKTDVTYKDWTSNSAFLSVVADVHKSNIGVDLFDKLGLADVQQQATKGKENDIPHDATC